VNDIEQAYNFSSQPSSRTPKLSNKNAPGSSRVDPLLNKLWVLIHTLFFPITFMITSMEKSSQNRENFLRKKSKSISGFCYCCDANISGTFNTWKKSLLAPFLNFSKEKYRTSQVYLSHDPVFPSFPLNLLYSSAPTSSLLYSGW